MSARVRLPARLPELVADDRTLLARFAAARDEAAFAALVRRHGGTVLGVCRRAVRDAHLAEDACQAVFLVLARNPDAAARAASVGGWLFGVARRVGLAARRRERRWEKRQTRANPERKFGGGGEAHATDHADLCRVLDEELAALPDEYRAALLACVVRGQTLDGAARELGWSVSTLRRRLDRGKELLHARLTRRGATLAGVLVGAAVPSTATALSPRLIEAIVLGHAPAAVHALAIAAAGGSGVGKLVIAAALLAGGLTAGAVWNGAAPMPVADPADVKASAPIPSREREWATIRGRVVVPATTPLPARREITRADGFVKDAECCFADGRRLFFEDVLIDPAGRGIGNAVVWLRPDTDDVKTPFPRDAIHPGLVAARSVEHRVAVVDCQFAPRITAARAGDTLRFDNPAPVATNVKYDATATGPGAAFGPFNVLLAATTGTHRPASPLSAGRTADAFGSTIYPWMRGHVRAFDHPYFAVTDGHGRFTIPHAPPGRWRLVVWHEVAGYGGGQRRGSPVTVAADTDLGAVPLESDRWGPRE